MLYTNQCDAPQKGEEGQTREFLTSQKIAVRQPGQTFGGAPLAAMITAQLKKTNYLCIEHLYHVAMQRGKAILGLQ